MPQMGGGLPGQGPDYNKLILTEKDNIELVRHRSVMESSEAQLIKKLKNELE